MEFNQKFILIILLGLVIIIYSIMQYKTKLVAPIKKNNAPASASASAPILDRLPLVRENPFIAPANEIYQANYKDWENVEHELYANDKPLFDLAGPVNLVAPDINSTRRRVNFVEC